jgi:hypothetical protein
MISLVFLAGNLPMITMIVFIILNGSLLLMGLNSI